MICVCDALRQQMRQVIREKLAVTHAPLEVENAAVAAVAGED